MNAQTTGSGVIEIDTTAQIPVAGPFGPSLGDWIPWAACNGASECSGDNNIKVYRTRSCSGTCSEELTQTANIGKFIGNMLRLIISIIKSICFQMSAPI